MKRIIVVAVLIAVVLLLALYGVGYALTGIGDPVVLADLARVREATAKYRDVNAALADGYVRASDCASDPQLGGMGIHYINSQRMADPAINILKPEMLLYVQENGRIKLLGVEYYYGIGAPNDPIPEPAPLAPVVLGHTLNGPMRGHWLGEPPHFDLHVWVWQENPSGMFAQYNPTVKCN